MRYWIIIVIIVFGLMADSCVADGSSEQEVQEEPRICDPGKTEFCACVGGDQGVQVCNADGSGYEECVCPDVNDNDTQNNDTFNTTDTVEDFIEEPPPDLTEETLNEPDSQPDPQDEEPLEDTEEEVAPVCEDLDDDVCPEGDSCCGGECINLETSNDHCGTCTKSCSPGEECIEGLCSCGQGFCDSDDICSEGKCSTLMASIPAGPFMMGCNTSVDGNCPVDDREIPYHTVEISEYEIDVTEVTNVQYVEFFNASGAGPDGIACTGEECVSVSDPRLQLEYVNDEWRVKSGKDHHPVVQVTWYGARSYCIWLGKRLCSESEWEKAARGIDGRIYPWGNEPATCDFAVMSGNGAPGCGTGAALPVGSRASGVYDLYDMAGNVREWVEDDYHDNYTGAPDQGEPWVENPRPPLRVCRGGCFSHVAYTELRASDRYGLVPNGSGCLGVRCCRNGL